MVGLQEVWASDHANSADRLAGELGFYTAYAGPPCRRPLHARPSGRIRPGSTSVSPS